MALVSTSLLVLHLKGSLPHSPQTTMSPHPRGNTTLPAPCQEARQENRAGGLHSNRQGSLAFRSLPASGQRASKGRLHGKDTPRPHRPGDQPQLKRIPPPATAQAPPRRGPAPRPEAEVTHRKRPSPLSAGGGKESNPQDGGGVGGADG